jgi:hypothetical protein
MRPVRLLLLAPLLAGLTGCGSNPQRTPALAPVRLTIDAPLDAATVDQGTIEVHGRVSPAGARVLVAGDEAGVDGGAFSAIVQLAPGANVIDVEAGAPRRAAAMTAVRVVRRVPVAIPQLAGETPADAIRTLEGLGFKTTTEKAGGLLDDILPGTVGVCDTVPGAGQKVKAGSTVKVRVAKSC